MKHTQSAMAFSILALTASAFSACGSDSGDGAGTGGNVSATGGNVSATGGNASATGGNASATGGNASATGGNASATGGNASGIAGNASATGGNASATGGNASATGGNASATGGNASGTAGNASGIAGNASATGGNASATGGNASGTAGNASGTAGNASGTGGVPAGMCNKSACDACFSTPKNGACAVLDNPCNDDAACDPKQTAWIDCICMANGDTVKQATCDATFKTVGNVSADIVTCTRSSCDSCYGSAGNVCPMQSAPCQTCLKNTCPAEIGTCQGNSACTGALSPFVACVCDAQDAKAGTVPACLTELETAGGTLGAAITTCGKANCATECAF